MDFQAFKQYIESTLQWDTYAEVKLERTACLIQLRGVSEWKVQFYKTSNYPIVEMEFNLPRSEEMMIFAHEALFSLENGSEFEWNVLKKYSRKLIVIRKESDSFKREDVHIASFKQFGKYMEELQYDETVVKLVDGDKGYYDVIKTLKEYGLERG